jgi:hypothetical protein
VRNRSIILLVMMGIPEAFIYYFNHDIRWSYYAAGFLIGMAFQGYCNREDRIKLRDELLDMLKKCSPRMKPILTVIKK